MSIRQSLGVVAIAVAALFSVGCGAFDPEPEYPRGYVPPPPPPTSEELAARAQADATAQAEAQATAEYEDTDPSAVTEFKPVLEAHGRWVDDATYGTVWVPNESEVGADFTPYVTAGHWTYADDTDWVWVSDYSWGWAPFHYGRWVYLPGYGWSWIAGRRYAGAWVVWRTGPVGYGYVGWAPMAPDWYGYNGVAVGWGFGWYRPSYVYCAHAHVYHPSVGTYVVRGDGARVHDGRTQDYVAASPGVGGSGRVVASPGVGGSGDRVLASPGVGGRVAASPGVRGPRPADDLGLKGDAIVAPPSNHQGLARAQTLATPRSAIAQGAAPPASFRPSSTPAFAAAAPSRSFEARPAQPYIPPQRAALPDLRPTPEAPRSSFAPSQPYAQPSPSFRSTSPYASSSSSPLPSYRPSPSVSSSPSFRSSTPSVSSSPSFRSSPSFAPSPSFRSSPSISASPSFRSAAPSVRSSPSFRSSPATPAVRSGGAGFRRR
jgi:hypothetical protein